MADPLHGGDGTGYRGACAGDGGGGIGEHVLGMVEEV